MEAQAPYAAHTAAAECMQGTGMYGAGDFLMSFLGVIILSFAFKIFDQRRLMVRHAPEILGACAVSACVSMVSTAALCRLAGLTPGQALPPHPHVS